MITEKNLYIVEMDGIVRLAKKLDSDVWRIMGSLVNYDDKDIKIIKPFYIDEQLNDTEENLNSK
jgi:hypothetical protein